MMTKKYSEIRKLLELSEYDSAYNQLNLIPQEERKNFQYVRLMFRYLMAKKDFQQIDLLLSNNKFEHFQYQSMCCNYYNKIKNIEKMQIAVDKLNSFNPPKNISLIQMEHLYVLKSDFSEAALCVKKLIDISEILNLNLYRRLLDYLYEAESFNTYIDELENILKLNLEFIFFKQKHLLNSLTEIFDEEDMFKYIIKLVTKYPKNPKLKNVLNEIIAYLDINVLKTLISEKDKKIIQTLNISNSIKILLDIDKQTNKPKSNIDNNNLNNFQLQEIIYLMISNNEPEKALELAKKMSNPDRISFLINNIPKQNNLKRESLIKPDFTTKNSIIFSPQSNDAKGTIICFTGLALKTMIPIEIIDRFFAALNLNAIYLLDISKTLYLDGINGYSDSIDTAVKHLESILKQQGTKDIYTLGTSAGGMASIIYANKLRAKASLAFSPLSSLTTSSETRAKVLIKRMKNNFSKEELNIDYYLTDNNSSVPIEIFYADDMSLDTMQAQPYLTIENICVNKILNSDRHDSLTTLLERENFINLLSDKLRLSEK